MQQQQQAAFSVVPAPNVQQQQQQQQQAQWPPVMMSGSAPLQAPMAFTMQAEQPQQQQQQQQQLGRPMKKPRPSLPLLSEAAQAALNPQLLAETQGGCQKHHLEKYAFFADTLQLPLLSDAFCDELVREVQGRENGTDGVHLQERYGLFAEIVELVSVLLAEPQGKRLRFSHAFVVHYAEGDAGHAPHADNSDLTINVALNEGYEEGELQFDRGECEGPKLCVRHRKRWATMHDGRRIHGSRPATGGPRYNLVIWADLDEEASSFTRFPELPRHLQRLALSFLPVTSLGHAGMTCRQLAEESARDELWWPLVEANFDTLVFREMLRGDCSFQWVREPGAKLCWARCNDTFLHERRFASQGQQQMKCTFEMARANARRLETMYRKPLRGDMRRSGLLEPVSAAEASMPVQQQPPVNTVCPSALRHYFNPAAGPASDMLGADVEATREATALASGGAPLDEVWAQVQRMAQGSRLHVLGRKGAYKVRYYRWTGREWRGVYEDELRWVARLLAQAGPDVAGPAPVDVLLAYTTAAAPALR